MQNQGLESLVLCAWGSVTAVAPLLARAFGGVILHHDFFMRATYLITVVVSVKMRND